MAKTVKNCSTVNHSTRTATEAHDTSTTFTLIIDHLKSLAASLDESIEREAAAKNLAYLFIVRQGLFDEWLRFRRNYAGNPHADLQRALCDLFDRPY